MSYAIPFASPAIGARERLPVATSSIVSKESTALVVAARRLYEMRKARGDTIGDCLFSEPAWDILLDLFISYHEGRQLSVSAVCIGARAPSATALRYLAMLTEAGLVQRTRDQTDGRRSHVQLSVAGRMRMAEALGMLIGR